MGWVRIFVVLGGVWTGPAFAESFVCEGTGRFAGLPSETIVLNWATDPTRVLYQTDSTRVQVGLDRRTDRDLGFFKIEVYDANASGNKGTAPRVR